MKFEKFPKELDNDVNRVQLMQQLLRKSQDGKEGMTRFPVEFGLAIDPRVIVTAILSDSCSIFTSKKKPVNLKM